MFGGTEIASPRNVTIKPPAKIVTKATAEANCRGAKPLARTVGNYVLRVTVMSPHLSRT